MDCDHGRVWRMPQGDGKVHLYPIVRLARFRVALASDRDAVTQSRACEAETIGVGALELRRRARGVPVVAHRGRQIEVTPPTGQGLVDVDLPLAARASNSVC